MGDRLGDFNLFGVFGGWKRREGGVFGVEVREDRGLGA